jgi:hypothetical protein
MYWRKSIRAEDDARLQKSLQSERSSEDSLRRLDALSGELFTDRLVNACGR